MAFSPVPLERPSFVTKENQNIDPKSFVSPNFLVPDLQDIVIRGRGHSYYLQMNINYKGSDPKGNPIFVHEVVREFSSSGPWVILYPGDNLSSMVTTSFEDDTRGCGNESIASIRDLLFYRLHISYHRYTPASLGGQRCSLLAYYIVAGIEFDPNFWINIPVKPFVFYGNAAPPPPPPKNMPCCDCNTIATIIAENTIAELKQHEATRDHIDRRTLEGLREINKMLQGMNFNMNLQPIIDRLNELEANLWNGIKSGG